MHILITNFGDDSIALIHWAYQNRLTDLHILSIATGWEDKSWGLRIKQAQEWINNLNIPYEHLIPKTLFSDNVIARKRFPSKKFHWCPSFLKGMALLDWLDENDPECSSTILLAHRSSMSKNQVVGEYIEEHEHYDDRKVWFPLHQASNEDRNKILLETPFPPLNHRSLECQPCIYNSYSDFKRMSHDDAQKASALENKVQSAMFNPIDYNGAKSVLEIKEKITTKEILPKSTKTYYDDFATSCSWSYGCGL
jgi:hypothetical protein